VTDADALIIGSGPNGLVAATQLARAGWRVIVVEQAPVAGGAIRTEALTVPGYLHDTFSAFYGVLHASPVFTELELDRRVQWASFAAPVAAAVDPHTAGICYADIGRTVAALEGQCAGDGEAWRDLYRWWLHVGGRMLQVLLSPIPSIGPTARLLASTRLRGTMDMARLLLEPVGDVARNRFSSDAAQALLAAGTSHSDLAADQAGSTPGALALAMTAQQVGMPVPVGGAGRLADALVDALREAGGTVLTDHEVTRVIVEKGRAVGVETTGSVSLRAERAVLADVGPLRLFRGMVGEALLPAAYLAGLRRFRYGSGIFKLDLALDGEPGWQAEGLEGCGVVHLTGDLDGMGRAGSEVRRRLLPAEPLLVVGQQSSADPSRAPAGGHTLWIETHVPSDPKGDGAGVIHGGPWPQLSEAFCERVLDRLEWHAPGLRSRIVGLAVHTPPDLEAANPNLVGGDLAGGSMALDQQAVFRPVTGWFRYATPVRGLYLCSASAHPGGGVHGMVGRNCARRVLADARLRRI
jgi:phytoene dehydrogenase-like protein